ncbi:MAG: hypothetical protein ACI8ZB_005253 [Desulforhopalus sp.]|jgi:hypothetical protein
MSIPEKDQKILWGKSAGRCSMPHCRKSLTIEASEKVASKNILIGQNCHIVAESKDGPRGESILGEKDRNRYPNLILLCVNHHTEIDQDPDSWPLEYLHQIKADHEIWVETQLAQNEDSIPSRIYSNLINSITNNLLLSHWHYFADHAVRFLLSEEFVDGANHLFTIVHKTIWPGVHPELEESIKNLNDRVSSYVSLFVEKATLRKRDENDVGYFVEDMWWKRQWREDYHVYAEASKLWERKCLSMLFNIVVALNEYADSVRRFVNPSYFIYEGKFIIDDSMGVMSEMVPAIHIPKEYIDIENIK